jgi:phosphoglycolate phosphatase
MRDSVEFHRGGLLTDVIEEQVAVLGLLGSAQAVLFDFDGPVCDLFGGASTAHVANDVKRKVRKVWPALDPKVEACTDSHGILRHLRDMYDRRPPGKLDASPLAVAEGIVADFESGSVPNAQTAPHFVALVHLLLELRMRLAIVSNNAEGPIREYLQLIGLQDNFEVFGRDPRNAGRMKPDPFCVEKARARLSLKASECLLIGDQITDLKAARAVGTLFLGYTRDGVRKRQMKHYGANAVVSSHLPVVTAARTLISIRYGPTSTPL